MPDPTALPRSKRQPGLDLLRAVAILWVMLYHGTLFGLVSYDHWVVAFGWMGVDLFFVLSGFLIAAQLLRPLARGTMPDYGRFFLRRLLRTVPAYLVVVAFCFLWPTLRERADIQPLWQFLTFTENLFINVSTPKAFSHVWSLCVEEQFYLVFPAIVALLALRVSTRTVVLIFAGVALAGVALRGGLWLGGVATPPWTVDGEIKADRFMELIYYPSWTRLDGLVAGVLAATIREFRPALWTTLTSRPNLLFAAGIAGLGLSIVFFEDQIPRLLPTMFGYPLLALSMALMVCAASEERSLVGRIRIPAAGAVAAGAYSIYLTHKLVYNAFGKGWIALPDAILPMRFPIAILAAFCVGAALYWIVERPFLRLRDRISGRSLSSMARTTPAPQHPAQEFDKLMTTKLSKDLL